MEHRDGPYDISSLTAIHVCNEVTALTSHATYDEEAVGRAVIEKVMRLLAEHSCRDGHRYDPLPGEPVRLYCRRCGAVVEVGA
jgi:hypothetical protein